MSKEKYETSKLEFGVLEEATKEEHEAWGDSLPPEQKKYYHPWPWCK